MKIMYLMFSYTVGGTERLIADICNNMLTKQNEIHLLIINNMVDERMIRTLNSNVHIELLNRTVGGKQKIRILFKVAKYIKKHKIEVIHCNSLDAPELLLVSKIVSRQTKVFYTIHGMNQYCQLNKWRVFYRNIICDKIIAISESVKRDIIEAGAKANKVQVIYNAIDFERMQINAEDKHIFDSKNIVIGNVARFQPEIKGQDILIDAVKQLIEEYPTVKCLFAGEADDIHQKMYDDLKQTMQQQYPENIYFVGNIDNVAEFLSKIDIFVLPSRSEGFGISLVEAMSMKIPCIASRLEGPEEVLEFGKRGRLFDANDSEALCSVIKNVIENYSKEKEIAENNCSYVRRKYNIENMTETLLSIYANKDKFM